MYSDSAVDPSQTGRIRTDDLVLPKHAEKPAFLLPECFSTTKTGPLLAGFVGAEIFFRESGPTARLALHKKETALFRYDAKPTW